MFIVISSSSRRYYSNDRNIMNLEKKSPVLKTGLDKMYVNKHSDQSCKCNVLKGSEHNEQSKSN